MQNYFTFTLIKFRQLLCLGLLSALFVPKVPAADDSTGIEFFEKKIRPILTDNCYKCHSAQSEKVKGGLLLDTHEGLLKGGDNGPAIEPGNPEKSLLIKAIRYADENLQMPPKGKKLPADQIASLEAWVKMGAPDPRVASPASLSKAETIRDKAQNHWAFQPIKRFPPPEVKNKRWAQTGVDNFILQKLEAKHLQPSPRADKRTLIRRAFFDLTGLPPKPEEVTAFLADTSPDAFARVVDHLLASPQYGERWGRHWLDVARYADTKGYVFEEERRYPFSYTYRDYVIRAFNEDLPYDQFITQQIAADLLPLGEDKRPLAALGYMTLGRRFVNNIHDIIDDRIDVVCRGMMGLTVNCARCHDHKFDPIPTKDYYSLYGIFASSEEPQIEPLLGTHGNVKAYQEYLDEHAKREKERKDFIENKQRETATSIRHRSGDYLFAAYESEHRKDQDQLKDQFRKEKIDDGLLQRWKNSLGTWNKTTNAIFAPWFAFAALPTNDFSSKARDLTASFSTNKNSAIPPLLAKAFSVPPTNINEVAARYGSLFVEIDKKWQAAQTNSPPPQSLSDMSEESLRQILYAADSPCNLPVHEFDRFYDIPTGQNMRALQRKVDELDATHPGAPPRAMALVDKASPYNVQVFIRGNSDRRGPEVPRQFLEVVAGKDRKPFTKGSGRLELAQAIANTNNPLTARVFVNRVWMHHFGAPLVATPSDFGLRSEPPTHPELLDYLAARFMDEGWSIKKLHRWIMLSSTYQQTSEDNPAFAKIDPGNQLVWHMNRQRLEFEALRDTLLAVAGKLDLTPGGHSVDITSTPFTTRRTVYGYIDRQNLPNIFRTFDLASPDTTNPRRFFTTVPQQALFLMNSPFVVEQAKTFANRAEFKNAKTDEQRLRLLYQTAFQRDPTRDEVKLAEEFMHSQLKTATPQNTATNWLFGFGSYDLATKHTGEFTKLPYFDGRAFQGGPVLPDPSLGWVVLSGTGGHPGNDLNHDAIRRWIAPRAGKINISGTLGHPASEGNGVRGRIVSSRLGTLGEYTVHHDKKETALEHIEVKPGDIIDFITDNNGDVDSDSFSWAPNIRYAADASSMPGQKMEWSALNDFAEAARATHPELDVWQRYAQVLLLTNELVFVD
ncbi:PSD1 and planctomycete cytochrome C domain-containing protein [Pedosphaera parvula]|uniref:Cytochrome c domain-containing protein n=1 Tax=Pedosphaera parvula (strain Ellin514) TaxID=320771 RepID=B9XR58_PEDPL|nr:PSD1 and planctomycete cytochrome C domain-containing protein [Pedosphaera parvula]EEF57671.1 protein of unknown function DUF1549 [Pedosphaera parvula Ellin514]